MPMIPVRDLDIYYEQAGQGPRLLLISETGGDLRRDVRWRAANPERWARLSTLVLLAAGRYDSIAPAANMQALARRIPEAELRPFEGGHLFFIQDEDAYPYVIQ